MGEGIKMQCSDWPKAFHSTYTQIVVAQRQNQLHKLNFAETETGKLRDATKCLTEEQQCAHTYLRVKMCTEYEKCVHVGRSAN